MTNPEIACLINSILLKHGIPIVLSDYTHLYIDHEKKIVYWNRSELNKILPTDLISNYLNEHIFKRISGTPIVFSHYMRDRKYFEQIKETGHLRFYSLSKFVKNNQDKNEYRYLIDLSNPNWIRYEEQIEYLQNSAFIFCLTDMNNSNSHLQEYSNSKNGVQLSVKINYLSEELQKIQLKKVVYGIPFLEEIFYELKKIYGLTLDLQSLVIHAPFVKKCCFSWESEFRLCINRATCAAYDAMTSYLNSNEPDSIKSKSLPDVKTDELGNKYILLPLKNPLIEIEITEV